MKSAFVKVSLLSLAFAAVVTSCKKSGGFDTDKDTGVQYRFIVHNDNGKKPAEGDIAKVEMIAHGVSPTNPDTEIYNSILHHNPGDSTGTYSIPIRKSFYGCLEEGFTMMAQGDSAIFKISADSLYLKTFHNRQLPKFIKPGTFLTFNIKMVSFQTKEEMQAMQKQEMEKRQAEMEKHKAEEPKLIADYIKNNHYEKIKPTKDSLFILDRKGGDKSKPIKVGDSIFVNYTGMLLDGTVFDASQKHNSTLNRVYAPNMPLIKGWIEALGTMHEGEKARILLPSALAYGPQQAGPMIPPYSPLLFDLEVVKVKHNKAMPASAAHGPAMMQMGVKKK